MSADPNQPLRVAIWNVENLFVFLDKWSGQPIDNLNELEWQLLTSAVTKNKPLRKVRWLAQTLIDIQPDIIMLSEVGGAESLENFNRHFLNNQYQPFLVEGNSDRGIDVGYLVKRGLLGKFLLISHRERKINFWYPNEDSTKTPSHRMSRDVAELRWFAPGSHSPNKIFLLVHLKSRLDAKNVDSNGTLRRAAELKALVQIYNEIRQECPKTSVLVGGDFNGPAHLPEKATEFLPLQCDTDLREVFGLLNIPEEEATTQINVYHNVRQKIKIDHLFVSPELAPRLKAGATYVHRFKNELGEMLEYAQTYEQRLALPSDHYPIVCEITDFWIS